MPTRLHPLPYSSKNQINDYIPLQNLPKSKDQKIGKKLLYLFRAYWEFTLWPANDHLWNLTLPFLRPIAPL